MSEHTPTVDGGVDASRDGDTADDSVADGRPWLSVGADVATLPSAWQRRGQAPTFSTVARIGKRDVVLEDGQRFNVVTLQRRNGGTWDGHTALLPSDHPTVAEALAQHRHAQAVSHAKRVAENWSYGRKDVTPVDVILALAPLTDHADEIRALLEPAAPGDAGR